MQNSANPRILKEGLLREFRETHACDNLFSLRPAPVHWFIPYRPSIVLVATLWVLGCFSTATVTAQEPAATPSQVSEDRAGDDDQAKLEEQVKGIFKNSCYGCHGAEKQESELNLSTAAGIVEGSESGPVLVPGEPEESLLFELVREGLMPPDEKQRLPKDEVEAIRKWIEAGAKLTGALDASSRQVTSHAIIPLMHLRCTVCHGLRRQEAGLDLRTKASMLKGGKSGPAMVPGDPSQSLLLKRILAEEMPPRDRLVEVSIKVIEAQEIELLTKWIDGGAPEAPAVPDAPSTDPDLLVTDEDRQFWSFRPPEKPPIPQVRDAARVRNPVDAFVLEKLEKQGLSLSPETDRLTLLRRATFDLTGLPPEPDEIVAFLADTTPNAYERLLDRLLASPLYGERWGRYWLDLAGYADSEGKREQDVVRLYAYRYRDYVIRAFNADKPYDRFLTEQIAGDELADYESAEVVTEEMYDNLVATGFLRMAPDDTLANITNFVPNRLEVVADQIQVLGSAVMGLTMQCCRCHSHKFDPIPQRDYYRFLAVFKGAFDEHDWLKPQKAGLRSPVPSDQQRSLGYVTTAEREGWLASEGRLTARIQELSNALNEKQNTLQAKYRDERLACLPAVLHDDLRKMLDTPAAERTEVQNYLAEKFEKHLRLDSDELKKLDAPFKQLAEESQKQIDSLEARRLPEPKIRALWDRGEPSPTYLLRRGNYLTPGRLVGPGVPSVLTDGKTPFEVLPPWPGAKKTGRRLALARWLTKPDHPLTARVMANRIWTHHFGRGIVTTPANFGKAGARPTHPELLDWLAVEFPRQGWSIKAMHRLIMTSSTYRQSSKIGPEHEKLDPENRLFSRTSLRRLDAEAIRDTLFVVSGQLNVAPFGPPDLVTVRSDGLITANGTARGWRRSIYVRSRRKELPTLLENFDLPQMNPNCTQRSESTVATQALHLLNNKMVRDLADDFAARVRREAGGKRERQIERMYAIALARRPSTREKSLALETLARIQTEWQAKLAGPPAPETARQEAANRALGNLCHAIINSAEFLYLD